MTPLALCLVLTAAVLHATWNLAAKRAGSGLPFVFAVGVVMTICYVPIIAGVAWFGGGLHFSPGDWFVVGVSTVLKTGYALYLQRAYRKGDFSLVYPLVRGSAPVIATAGAALFLGEFPPPIALLGGLIIVAGIFFLTYGERLWQRRPGRTQPPRGALGNALIAGSFMRPTRSGIAMPSPITRSTRSCSTA